MNAQLSMEPFVTPGHIVKLVVWSLAPLVYSRWRGAKVRGFSYVMVFEGRVVHGVLFPGYYTQVHLIGVPPGALGVVDEATKGVYCISKRVTCFTCCLFADGLDFSGPGLLF